MYVLSNQTKKKMLRLFYYQTIKTFDTNVMQGRTTPSWPHQSVSVPGPQGLEFSINVTRLLRLLVLHHLSRPVFL